jgi:glyoxylase-like metal-dependent hydrolase (beta-lactamase superfamily II)
MALVTCPTSSIGALHKPPLAEAVARLPERVEDEIWFCGYASESSYGASSWLIRRPGGNVLVDSPRAARPLLRRLEELGGVAILFLTHRDDVADHRAYHDRFGCARVLHRADLGGDTRDVELVLEGTAPTALAPDLLAIPVPGHTRGSCALLYRETFLFTGDHLWSDEAGGIEAGRDVCWYSWPEQIKSIARLAEHRFEWILPGHGRTFHAPSATAMREHVRRLAASLT